MQKALRNIINAFLIITIITASVTILGIVYLWLTGKPDLPYMKILIGSVILEIVGNVFLFVKQGRRYLPEIMLSKNELTTAEFIKKFVSNSSSITIVSNRVSWLSANENLRREFVVLANSGTRIEIITPNKLSQNLLDELKGISFFVTNEPYPPEARFTLINGERGGCERLAIARGAYPEHEITIFDNYSGPQMISMAKDIIKKGREKANA